MFDLKWIRENPDAFDAGMKRRGLEPQSSSLLEKDAEHRKLQTLIQELQNQRNSLAKEIGALKSKGESADHIMAEANRIKDELPSLEEKEKTLGESIRFSLSVLPNIPNADVPNGKDETSNLEMRAWSTPPTFSFKPKAHDELGESLGLMNFDQAAKIAGSRFVVTYADMARLERALAAFMLDLHTTEFGYTEVSPPLLVRDDALFGTGQLPKFEEDLFKTTDSRYLIPTSEVSLTNLVRESILSEKELPLRFVAHTPCFRSEAGSAGRDTRGMIRMHQFNKVELVSITKPEESEAEHERMVEAAEEVLKRLGLPYRLLKLCTGDMSPTSQRTYDLEVWLPSQDCYREISSCSTCGDYQARRMNARFKGTDPKAKTQFVHTLNGSGVAVGRALVAVLENYQQEDGSIRIPNVLIPYMGGQTVIRKKSD